jgi:predicted O-methyltransferase YrrM
MINYNFLRLFTKPGKLVSGLRHPRAVFQMLEAVSVDIPRMCRAVGMGSAEFDAYVKEVRSNKAFKNSVLGNLERFTKHLKKQGLYAGTIDEIQCTILYAINRFLMPEVVLETGVASGLSSAYILLALENNNKGKLYSIDLPFEEGGESSEWATLLPSGEKSGWLIPQDLRHRWELTLGKSSDIMPDLLKELESIDVFLHDSDHSYENMKWEYRTVWPYLKRGGVLLSHDIEQNEAFSEFCREVEGQSFTYKGGLGGIVKVKGERA